MRAIGAAGSRDIKAHVLLAGTARGGNSSACRDFDFTGCWMSQSVEIEYLVWPAEYVRLITQGVETVRGLSHAEVENSVNRYRRKLPTRG